jgi:hypothetical protein
MRCRLAVIAILVVVASIGAGVAASTRPPFPEATCTLPNPNTCLTDSECLAYGAVCDVPIGMCVCTTDLGAGDLGGADFSTSDGGGGADGGGGGPGGSTPPAGGGMTSPPKSSGCSFAPGSR